MNRGEQSDLIDAGIMISDLIALLETIEAHVSGSELLNGPSLEAVLSEIRIARSLADDFIEGRLDLESVTSDVVIFRGTRYEKDRRDFNWTLVRKDA